MSALSTIKVAYDIPGVYWITLDRPAKYNAWSFKMYDEIVPVLKAANADPECKIIVLTGNGKFFTSGNDQNNFFDPDVVNRPDEFRNFIDLLIDMDKPMIALVNGPAVGMGVTMLGHFDLIIASDSATFSTPFSRLALCAEGCSSLLFPQIMGYSNAAELLLFNKTATATEMKAYGMVSRVIPHHVFEEETRAIIREQAQLSVAALVAGKRALRSKAVRASLHEVNHHESQVLKDMYFQPEALEAVRKFQNRKSKL